MSSGPDVPTAVYLQPPTWKVTFHERARQRDTTQRESFRLLFEHYAEVLRSERELRDRALVAEREASELRREVVEFHDTNQRGREGGVSSARVVELEDKVMRLSDELTTAMRLRADGAQSMLDMTHQLQDAQKDLEQTKKELALSEERCEQGEQQLQDQRSVITTLREELEAAHHELEKVESLLANQKNDYSELLERWLRKANEDVDTLNATNEMVQGVIRRRESEGIVATAVAEVGGRVREELRLGTVCTTTLPSKVKHTIKAHESDVNTVCFNIAGTMLATGSNDNTIKLWDSQTGSHKATLHGSMQAVMRVQISVDDVYVLGASNDKTTRLWTVEQGRVRHTLTGHTGKIYAGVFGPDSKKVITGSHDRTIKLWDLTKGYCTKTVFCFSSCNTLTINPDNLICSGHVDARLRFWAMRTGEQVEEMSTVHGQQITSVSFSSDGSNVLTLSRDNTLKLVDIRTYGVVKTYADPDFRNGLNWTQAAFSPDGMYVAAGGADGGVYIWEKESTKVSTVLRGHPGTVGAVAWNPQTSQLASGGKDAKVLLWSA